MKKQDAALFVEAFFSEVIDDKNVWVADTCVSHHMTKTKKHYSCYNAFDEPQPITLGNQQLILAYGQGDIQVEALASGKWQGNVLKNVWYSPEVVKNLFSMSTAADKGIEYWLDKSCKLIHDGETIVVGERNRGLYNLLIRVVIPKRPAELFSAKKIDTLQVWHECLGHQNK